MGQHQSSHNSWSRELWTSMTTSACHHGITAVGPNPHRLGPIHFSYLYMSMMFTLDADYSVMFIHDVDYNQ